MFTNLKIVELGSVLAVPAVGTFFAELGAEVVKVENPDQGGDVTRSWKHSSELREAHVSAYFSSVNYGKKHVFYDLKVADQLEVVRKMCIDADIVLSNFKPGDDTRYGLDFESLKIDNPRLIYGHLFGFRSNPTRVAYDTVLQAETGFMSMNGEAGGPPVKMPVALIDVLGAHQLKEGLLVALLKLTKTGKGCKVEVTLEESALSSLINQAGNYLMCNAIPKREGTLHPNIAPYGEMFETADNRLLVLAVGNNKQFVALCSILNIADLAKDERFIDNPNRVANRKELFEILVPIFYKRNAAEWMEQFIKANVPAGVVNDLGTVFSENPVAQSMVLEEYINGIHTKRMRSVVFRLVD